MNSAERHEARYRRRKEARERRKTDRARAVGGLSRVFSFTNMYQIGKKCCNGVRWKRSTQNFEMHLISQTAKCRRRIFEKKWKPGRYKNFVLRERGKVRNINAPTIQDRQVHKTLNRYVLLPLYKHDMIYNNGASLPGKGLDFALRLLSEELRQHYRKYGREGSIILSDFRKFFPTAPHGTILERHKRLLKHPNIRQLADIIVTSFPGNGGLPLGVEVSQMEMVALPSPLDNFMKCQLRLKGFGHYMDDYHTLVPPDRDPHEILEKKIEFAAKLGLTVNREKTVICSLKKPFKFCKAKIRLTETGRVIISRNRQSLARSRRKFKRFKELYDEGKMTLWDVYQATQCSFGYFGQYHDHGRVLKLRRLIFALFGFSAEDRENFKEAIECSI